MNIILASASPRRTEILKLAKIDHLVIPSTCEEVIENGIEPFQVVESLSYQKAIDVFKSHQEDIVIGADTIVTIHGLILGKPHSKEEAIHMLELLSGKTHQVITGVTIMSNNQVKTFHEVTYVTFDELTINQIQTYIESENVYDKAGSYAVQGTFCKYISKIDGNYYNVVGLPISRLYKELKEFNYEVQ